MRYVGMALVGLVVGILARFFYPGHIPLGIIGTSLLGIAGSYFAGFLGNAIHGRGQDGFAPASFFWSVIGAMLLIFLGLRLGLMT